MLKSLLNFGKSKSILVCETDGFLLRAAVLVKTGNEVAVLQTAQSQQADMAEAVADVVKSLKADGWEGRDAVLLSPTVLSTLIELPVNPKKPRPLAQMRELVRWEAEPLLMQHTTQWSVGNLLVGRGYMTKEQADAVMDLQQGRPNAAGGVELSEKFSLRRFGDLAEELGYIKRSQLNACLAGQEWLKATDEYIECGWSPQGELPDVPGTYNWLVSAVNKTLFQRWTSAFKMYDVDLLTMYPLAGSSASLLSGDVASQRLIESQPGLSFVMQTDDKTITSQNLYIDPGKNEFELCLESYHALASEPSEASSVTLAQWHNDAKLHTALTDALDTKVDSLNTPPVSDKVSAGMVGASMHYYRIGQHSWVCDVRLGGPVPKFLARMEVRVGLFFMVLLLIIAASEATIAIRSSLVESHKKEVDQKWIFIDTAMKRIKANTLKIEQRKKELLEEKVSQEREVKRLHFFGEKLPERAALVQAILGILQESVGDDVVVNSIDEMGRRLPMMPTAPNTKKDTRVEVENFNISAWAVTETAAQQFIQRMKEGVKPWGLEIRDSNVLSRPGPLNIDGFSVSMRIVKLTEPSLLTGKATP